MKNKFLIVILLFISVVFGGCKGLKITYNTSGGSLDPNIKTFSVDYFPNKAPLVVPYLSDLFTEELTKYMRSKTGLDQLTESNGDIRFEGQIVEYRQKPMEIKKDEVAASNRLTIGIRVKYTNTLDEKFDFSSTFSQYEDYSTEADFNSVEETLIKKIIEKIIDDIYNKAIVNW